MTKGHPWQKRVRHWSYNETARGFHMVQRLCPANSVVYAVISDELYRKARTVFRRVARKRIIEDEREDFVAECMAKMTRGIGSFRPGNFHAWLMTIASHAATDELRKRTRRRAQIPVMLSLEAMGEAEVGSTDRAAHDAAIAVDQHVEEEAILEDFLRRVEEEFGPVARGVLEMKMSGVADELIADYYGLAPLGVGVILEEVGQLYSAYCAA